jgi:hypothetical protein
MMGRRKRKARKFGLAYLLEHPAKRRGMHQYWHHQGTTDVEAMRRDANYRLNDKKHPEESIIHYHAKGTPCGDLKHENFLFPPEEAANAA